MDHRASPEGRGGELLDARIADRAADGGLGHASRDAGMLPGHRVRHRGGVPDEPPLQLVGDLGAGGDAYGGIRRPDVAFAEGILLAPPRIGDGAGGGHDRPRLLLRDPEARVVYRSI